MILRGSANSDGARTSVARISPLRSRMSGRAVATASCDAPRRTKWLSGATANITSRAGDDRIDRGEHQDREADARPRLGGAVDIAAVEQRARASGRAPRLDGAAAGAAGGGWRSASAAARAVHRRHRRPGRVGMLPVTRVQVFDRSSRDRDRSAGGCTIVRRPLRQPVERVELRRLDRPQRQMPLRQALDAGRIVELRPFGAQRRDGVALAPDVAAQLGDALGAQRRFELDLVDIGRREHQQRR